MPAYKDKQGRWFAKFQLEEYTGKKRQVMKRGFARKADALAYENEQKALHNHSASVSLCTLAGAFLRDYGINHRSNSLRLIRSNLDRHIVPFLGEIKLNELKPIHVHEWQNHIRQSSLSESSKASINNTLRQLLRFAVKYYGFSGDFVAGIEPMGRVEASQKVITLEDWKKLDAVIQDKHYKALFSLLYWCGLRIGEVMALQLLDFDFIQSLVKIDKQYSSDSKKLMPLKTARSKRVVAIPRHVLDIVSEYLSAFHTVPPLPFALKTSRGINWALKRYCIQAGIEPISAHTLRHSHATLLIHSNISAPVIADRLGHSNTYTTMRVYAHAYADSDRLVAEALDKLT